MIKSEKQAPHPTGTGVDEGQSMYQNEQQDTRQHLLIRSLYPLQYGTKCTVFRYDEAVCCFNSIRISIFQYARECKANGFP